MIIGLRPNEELDRRYAAWAMFHQFNRLSIVNLYSTRASGSVLDMVDPIGPLNDFAITAVVAEASVVVLAWGDQELPEPEVVHRGAMTAYAVRRRTRGELMCYGLDRWQQPLPMQMSIPLIRAPLLRGEDAISDD